MKRRVNELWEDFAKAVLMPNCSAVQREEMRRAFHAGAFCIMNTLAKAMSFEDEMTEEDAQVMQDLSDERDEYLADLIVQGKKGGRG